MSKKTVGDLRNFEGKQPKAVREFLEHNNLLDALVNPGFIVTADRVEAAAKAARLASRKESGFRAGLPWEKLDASTRDEWLAATAAAITEAGGIVPDEVVEVSNDDGDPCPKSIIFWVPGDEEYSFVDLRVGDTLYIVRKED